MAKQVFDVQGPRVLNDEEIWIRCRQWLCETTNTYWLLLFKNYNDPDPFSIRQYYPHASQKTIIMTTRRPRRVKRTILQVQLLSSTEDGLAILQIRSQHENVKSGMLLAAMSLTY